MQRAALRDGTLPPDRREIAPVRIGEGRWRSTSGAPCEQAASDMRPLLLGGGRDAGYRPSARVDQACGIANHEDVVTTGDTQIRLNLYAATPVGVDTEPFGSIGCLDASRPYNGRSEEHTSELQSHLNIVCRLLL